MWARQVLRTVPAAGDDAFDADQLGARDFTITVDGTATSLDRSRVSSP